MAATVRTYHRKAVLSVVLTLCLILATLLPAFAATGISNEQLKAATSIARQMEDEGIVLLKNTGDFLPLKNKKVNVFGIASCDLLLSGGGSGSVTASESVNFYEGLKHGGIRYNKDLKTVYQNWKSSHSLPETGNGLIDMLLGYVQGDGVDEMPIENIPQEQMDSARAYSDTALIVFGSAGTELSDLSKKDLRLNETQRAMLDAVTSNFENVIVVFNTSNTMEMDWVEQYDNIRAALLMWLPGQVGAESLGDVLKERRGARREDALRHSGGQRGMDGHHRSAFVEKGHERLEHRIAQVDAVAIAGQLDATCTQLVKAAPRLLDAGVGKPSSATGPTPSSARASR